MTSPSPAPDSNQPEKRGGKSSDGEVPSLNQPFTERNTPVSARQLLRDLYELNRTDNAVAYRAFVKRLEHADPAGFTELANGVENLIDSTTSRLPTRNAPYYFTFALLDTIGKLDLTFLRERVEGLYGKLVPLAKSLGDPAKTAQILMAAGEASERFEDPSVSDRIYDEAIAFAEAGKASHKNWMAGAYRFKIRTIIDAMTADGGETPSLSELQGWADRILMVADHIENKSAAIQGHPSIFRSLASAANAYQVLAAEGMADPEVVIKIGQRVVGNAMFCADPFEHPRAILELAGRYQQKGDWAEAVALRILAHEVLNQIDGPEARRLKQKALGAALSEISAHEFPNPGETPEED